MGGTLAGGTLAIRFLFKLLDRWHAGRDTSFHNGTLANKIPSAASFLATWLHFGGVLSKVLPGPVPLSCIPPVPRGFGVLSRSYSLDCALHVGECQRLGKVQSSESRSESKRQNSNSSHMARNKRQRSSCVVRNWSSPAMVAWVRSIGY